MHKNLSHRHTQTGELVDLGASHLDNLRAMQGPTGSAVAAVVELTCNSGPSSSRRWRNSAEARCEHDIRTSEGRRGWSTPKSRRGSGRGESRPLSQARESVIMPSQSWDLISYNAVTAMESHLIDLLDHPVIVAPHLHAKPFLGFSGSHASFAVRKRESTLECFGAPRVERKAACGRT